MNRVSAGKCLDLVRDQGVGGSNPLSPTIYISLESIGYKAFFKSGITKDNGAFGGRFFCAFDNACGRIIPKLCCAGLVVPHRGRVGVNPVSRLLDERFGLKFSPGVFKKRSLGSSVAEFRLL